MSQGPFTYAIEVKAVQDEKDNSVWEFILTLGGEKMDSTHRVLRTGDSIPHHAMRAFRAMLNKVPIKDGIIIPPL